VRAELVARSSSKVEHEGLRSVRGDHPELQERFALRNALPDPAASDPGEGAVEAGVHGTGDGCSGVPAMFVQAKAGHAQGSTTERYLHAARTSYPDAAELAGARLFGSAVPSAVPSSTFVAGQNDESPADSGLS
jgi:hypothetical protein